MVRDTQQYGCLIGLICVLKYDGFFLHPNKYEITCGGKNPRIKADEEVGTRSRLQRQKAGRENIQVDRDSVSQWGRVAASAT